jgi:hypothetical protein
MIAVTVDCVTGAETVMMSKIRLLVYTGLAGQYNQKSQAVGSDGTFSTEAESSLSDKMRFR